MRLINPPEQLLTLADLVNLSHWISTFSTIIKTEIRMELQEIERILKESLNVDEVYAQGENDHNRVENHTIMQNQQNQFD